jgi:CRISPR type III-A-associated protein Csm2
MLTKDKLINEADKIAASFIKTKKVFNRKKQKEEIVAIKSSKVSLTSSQLRRFFSEFKRLEMKLKSDIDYREVEPLIALQVAQVNYAHAKGKIPESFKNFIEEEVKKIDGKTAFNEFVKYFEAIVGFYYHYAKMYKLDIN